MAEILPSNAIILGQQSAVKAAKKKARRGQIEDIVFDDGARRRYLTGFHKRKMARDALAKAKAQKREREEKLQDRREKREAMLEQARKNRIDTERALGNEEIDDDFDPFQESVKGKPKEEKESYEGEEVMATVTVVEDLDMNELLNGPTIGPLKPPEDEESDASSEGGEDNPQDTSLPKTSAKMLELLRPPNQTKRKSQSYETATEKRDRVKMEKKMRLKKAIEKKEMREVARANPKKRKDDGGKRRPRRN